MSINMPEAKKIYQALSPEKIAALKNIVTVPAGLHGPDELRLAVIRHIANHIDEFRAPASATAS